MAAIVATTWVDDGAEGRLGNGTLLRVLEFAWTAHTSGQVLAVAAGNLSDPVYGLIDHVITTPGTGDDQPDSYDMVLLDDAGETHASKGSASNTAVESHTAGKRVAGRLHITIANAGSGNTGVVRVYLRM